jgi:transposase-like protein
MEDENDEFEVCPACAHGMGVPLGTLGNTTHYRCRNCGWQFAFTEEEEASK